MRGFEMYFRLLFLCLFSFFYLSQSQERLYKDGEILVKFKDNSNKVDTIIKQSGGNISDSFRLFNIYKIKLKDGISVEEAIKKFKENPNVEYAEPNYIVKKMETVPNDPYFDVQWGLQAINMTKAWDLCNGGNVVVAVLDSGIDYNHPDLKANIWKNEKEICGNGLDDDGNGFVDDCYGWNFAYNNNDVMDDDNDSHGTHVAGIIGAVGNNSIGVSGINWQIKIMPVKFLDSNGSGDLATVIKAIEYAVMMGAKVINASYGYPDGCGTKINPSKAEEDAIKKTRDYGVLFVAAAGNYGCNNDIYPFYPASYKLDNIISVAAVDKNINISSYSNYGKNSVHIAMPGVGIFSTVRTSINGGYDYKSGTSMAAPFVSGLGAFLMACKGYNYAQAKEAILATVNKKNNLSNYTISGGIADAYLALNYSFSNVNTQPSNGGGGCNVVGNNINLYYFSIVIIISLRRFRNKIKRFL